jgi:hypothetical protein
MFPGLESFRPVIQYFVCSVCQICVRNFKFNQNVEFNIHFLAHPFGMKKSKFTEAQIVFVIKQSESRISVEEICRKPGVSQQTFYNW